MRDLCYQLFQRLIRHHFRIGEPHAFGSKSIGFEQRKGAIR